MIGFIVVGVFYLKSAEIKSQPLGTSKIFEQSQVEAMSLKVIEFVHNDQFDELYKISNDVMKKAMTKEKIKEAISQFGELGEFQRITKQEYLEFVQKGQTTLTGDIVALYGKRSVIYRISFDNEMKLSGLYMR